MGDEWVNGKTPIEFKECKDMKFISEEPVCLKAFVFLSLPPAHNVINQLNNKYCLSLQTCAFELSVFRFSPT